MVLSDVCGYFKAVIAGFHTYTCNWSLKFCYSCQAVQLGNRENLLSFCEAVQRSSPVSSFIRPVAGATAGYASEV